MKPEFIPLLVTLMKSDTLLTDAAQRLKSQPNTSPELQALLLALRQQSISLSSLATQLDGKLLLVAPDRLNNPAEFPPGYFDRMMNNFLGDEPPQDPQWKATL